MSFAIAAQNLVRVVWNRTAKLYRRGRHWTLRREKDVREASKAARASVRHGGTAGRDAAQIAYAGIVRTSRYWDRLRERTWPARCRAKPVDLELRQ